MPSSEAGYAKAKAQAAKAAKMSGFLWGYKADGLEITGATVRALPADSRRTVEHLCGVRRSSDETWEIVAEMIDGMAKANFPEDPFDLFTG